jgi:hypothetical protein
MLLFVFVGSLLFRFADRQFLALLFQEPPRNTRADPDDNGQVTSKTVSSALLLHQPFVAGIFPNKLEPPEHRWPDFSEPRPIYPQSPLEPVHSTLES